MPMASHLRSWLKATHQQATSLPLSPQIVRDGLATLTKQYTSDNINMAAIVNCTVAQSNIHCRIYQPELKPPHQANAPHLPVILFLHGGGHLCGSIDIYDAISRQLASCCQAIVVTIGYRLAPEHPYPAGIDDALHSLLHIHETLTTMGIPFTNSLSLVGDSAGAAMAATLVQQLQYQEKELINKLVLIYPSLDYTLSARSLGVHGEGYLLESKKIEWYFDQYFTEHDDRHGASPLFGKLTHAHPETLVLTAQYCPIKDDGRRYYHRLLAHHVKAFYLEQPNSIHAFLNLPDLMPEASAHTYSAIAKFLS
ncbi:alpha/beta hydrolase [Photobacterium sanguinicancri]|uniref:Carboxylesterase n=1 Tax=Photobacterium sanguinicancri TaxID=875932 RepID=A0ABX4FYK8_9GAMM|nr:alpha/beta hydrolase [Photobacterium sanguinicancri]OZS43923.1 carboxylesterase [Photobacterium sanguinicancri]